MSESTLPAAATLDVFSVADAIVLRVAEGGVVLWVLAGFSIVGVAIMGVKALQFARLRIWRRAWLGWAASSSLPKSTRRRKSSCVSVSRFARRNCPSPG